MNEQACSSSGPLQLQDACQLLMHAAAQPGRHRASHGGVPDPCMHGGAGSKQRPVIVPSKAHPDGSIEPLAAATTAREQQRCARVQATEASSTSAGAAPVAHPWTWNQDSTRSLAAKLFPDFPSVKHDSGRSLRLSAGISGSGAAALLPPSLLAAMALQHERSFFPQSHLQAPEAAAADEVAQPSSSSSGNGNSNHTSSSDQEEGSRLTSASWCGPSSSREGSVASLHSALSVLADREALRAQLADASTRCADLQHENRRLKESTSASEDQFLDESVRRQLETLLLEKARLAEENCRLQSERQCLYELLLLQQEELWASGGVQDRPQLQQGDKADKRLRVDGTEEDDDHSDVYASMDDGLERQTASPHLQQDANGKEREEIRFWKAELDKCVEEKERELALAAHRHAAAVHQNEILRAEVFLLQQEASRLRYQLATTASQLAIAEAAVARDETQPEFVPAAQRFQTPLKGHDHSDEVSSLKAELHDVRARNTRLQEEQQQLQDRLAYLQSTADASRHEADRLRDKLMAQHGINDETADETVKVLGELARLQQANALLARDVSLKDDMIALLQHELAELSSGSRALTPRAARSPERRGAGAGASGAPDASSSDSAEGSQGTACRLAVASTAEGAQVQGGGGHGATDGGEQQQAAGHDGGDAPAGEPQAGSEAGEGAGAACEGGEGGSAEHERCSLDSSGPPGFGSPWERREEEDAARAHEGSPGAATLLCRAADDGLGEQPVPLSAAAALSLRHAPCLSPVVTKSPGLQQPSTLSTQFAAAKLALEEQMSPVFPTPSGGEPAWKGGSSRTGSSNGAAHQGANGAEAESVGVAMGRTVPAAAASGPETGLQSQRQKAIGYSRPPSANGVRPASAGSTSNGASSQPSAPSGKAQAERLNGGVVEHAEAQVRLTGRPVSFDGGSKAGAARSNSGRIALMRQLFEEQK